MNTKKITAKIPEQLHLKVKKKMLDKGLNFQSLILLKFKEFVKEK